MVDFVALEVVESDVSDTSPSRSEDEIKIHDRKKSKFSKEDVDSSEEEEDNEDRLREEMQDLIDDNLIEESDSDDSDGSSSKKRKRSNDEEELEDDDYDLLEENLGVKVERKKCKRLRRIVDEESDGEEEGDERRDRNAIAMEIFADDADDDHRSERSARPAIETDQYGEEENEDEYSDVDDFIVDDDDRPIADKRKKRKPVFTNTALQEAQETFGVDFDYGEFSKYDQDEDEDEEEDDYEDDDEAERRRRPKKTDRKNLTRKSIFEVYEPSELKRGFFTDRDNIIRNTDIPERMQIRQVPLTSVDIDSDELQEEAEWIYKQAFCKPTISLQDAHLSLKQRKGPQTVPKIHKALEFMRNQQLEVPFIAFYRKEYVQPELNINDLWKIYNFDAKWCQLKQRKEKLLALFEKMRSYQLDEIMKDPDAHLPEHMRVMKDSDIDRLNQVETPEELYDVYNHFILYYGQYSRAMQIAWRKKEHERKKEERRSERLRRMVDNEDEVLEKEEEEPVQEVFKYANRSGSYSLCSKAGIGSFAKRIGINPEHFAENLQDNYEKHNVEQESIDVQEVAIQYICPKFLTVEEVLQAVKFMIALQISREPLVRKCIREVFFERAKITVQATKKGIKVIDESHDCYSVKYLKNKPVRELRGDQFLKLVLAEEENLLIINISDTIDGNAPNSSYIDEVNQLYIRDEFSKIGQDWNAFKVECVERALLRYVLPDLRVELRRILLEEAREYVLKACCRKLHNWIKVAPYKTSFSTTDVEDWITTKGVKVMAVAYVPDYTQSAFACIAAPDGNITDYIRLPHLLKRKNSPREDEKLVKNAVLNSLRNFIYNKKPHVVCIGGESREALMIAEDIKSVIRDLVEKEQFPSIDVQIIDNELAKVYANCNKGMADFREYPELLRQAVSLARKMQDPLIEYSQLCIADEEILSLRFHTLQDQIPKEELLENLYLEFVNRTNEVGVDINRAVQHPHTSNLVQFICGLGPRKSQALMRLMKQTNRRLENRTQLVTSCHMGPKIFINCSGFVKIDTNSLYDSTESYIETLDSTRIHPETYEWSRKMAVDALEYDDDEGANPADAIDEILESPERLKDLDLDAFAEELKRQGFGNKNITLYDIRAELNSRYKDLRTQFTSAKPKELFDMLSKETPKTFYIGKMVTATVIGITHKKPEGDQLDSANPVRNDETGLWQCTFCLKNHFSELSDVWNHFDTGSCPGQATGVRLKLDNGISGYILLKNLSDKHVTNPEERVKFGQIIHCRIIKIDVKRFSVDCTSKSSDLADRNHKWRPTKDIYYDQESEDKDVQTEQDIKKNKMKQTYMKRIIVHPAFHNISYTEAERVMANMDQGEVIIRPSSKGSDHLTVTWKVTDKIYQHIDVVEKGKKNLFSLGKSLLINNEEFEDLDEIIARHVTPMASFARDLLYFKYYRDTEGGFKDKMEEFLKEEKTTNASKIHYFISASKNYPGKFMLSYLPRDKCRHEYVTVTSDGFKYRQQIFKSINGLFQWFKKHFRDPILGVATSFTPRQAANNFGSLAPNLSINTEAIQRVAQNLPSHMIQTLSAVASQTPHYQHTPGVTYGVANSLVNIPYTVSGQTSFITPYQAPHTHQTPRYGQFTSSPQISNAAPPQFNGPFLHHDAVTPSQRTTSYRDPGGGAKPPPHHSSHPSPHARQCPPVGPNSHHIVRRKHLRSNGNDQTSG